jgi:hypothetical protein
MMEEGRTSETLVNFYQSTRRYNPEASHLRVHRRENFKSCISVDRTALDFVISVNGNYYVKEAAK